MFRKFPFLFVLLASLGVTAKASAANTQLQWYIDTSAAPYAFGANIGGTWTPFGSATSTGARSVLLTSTNSAMVDLYTVAPTSGYYAASSPIFSFYPTIGNDPGDHQRAQELIKFNPTQDATISETGLTINSYINSGLATSWPGATTAVLLNKLVYNAGGYVWKATTAGTTGGVEPTWPASPTLGITTVTDGSVVWTAQTHNQSNAKMPLFISTTAGPNAGHVWSLDTATVLNSGWNGGFANGVEFDFANNSGADCLTCQTVFITGSAGANKIAAGISIFNGSATNYAYQDAIVLGGSKLATQSDIRSFSQSPYMIYDVGTNRTWGAYLGGNYTSGALIAFDAMREQKDFARIELWPFQAGNNNAWRLISNVNGAATDGTFVIQHSTDKFAANFTSYVFGTSGTFKITSLTVATLPTCDATTLGSIATITNGTAYATGTYGSAVSATGIVTRSVLCTNTAGATTYAWAYN